MFRLVTGADGKTEVQTIIPGAAPAPLAHELGRVRSAGVEVDRAVEQLERDRAGLFRPDGQPKFAPAEMAEREAVLAEGVRRAIAAADQAVVVATAEAERVKAAAASPDPSTWLSADELAAANSRRAFVSEDVAGLALPDLEKRLAGVVASDDRIGGWLYARYAGRRLGEIRRVAIEGGPAVPVEFGRAWALVEKLSASLRPAELDLRAEAAEKLRRAAADLRVQLGRAGRAASGVDTVGDAQRHMIRSIL